MALPSPRTWKRFRLLARAQPSLVRALEYEVLARLPLEAPVLDIGGGRRAAYAGLVDVGPVFGLNLSRAMLPAVVADANEPLPFRSCSFATVLSLNTFEHVRQDTRLLAEAVRVLRPGGLLALAVPFLYRVHGSPSDFHRHTAQWWVQELGRLPLDPPSIHVHPLVWDRWSSALALVEFTPLRTLVRPMALLPGLLQDRLAGTNGNRRARQLRFAADYAVGYFITARRARAG